MRFAGSPLAMVTPERITHAPTLVADLVRYTRRSGATGTFAIRRTALTAVARRPTRTTVHTPPITCAASLRADVFVDHTALAFALNTAIPWLACRAATACTRAILITAFAKIAPLGGTGAQARAIFTCPAEIASAVVPPALTAT